MNRRSINVICRQRIVEITHPQGTPLDIVLSLGPGMIITESTVFRADLQSARYPATAPLARSADVTAAPGATGPWTLALTGAQLNQTVTGESRRCWLPIYGVVGGTRIEPVAGIVLTLTANNISSLAPPPPVEPIYLTEASASDLYAALADFDALEGRVTSLESQEGGGAQADWNAVSGPSVILNKPSLGNSSSRNVGTGAGDVATGNHGHTTSQITGLDTALAAKADLSGGKLLASQLPDLAITQWLGTVANESAMLALVGQRGDWCARTDDGKVYIVTAEPSSSIGNWTSLSYPTAPVLSVAGRTGSITLGIGDISGLAGVLDTKVNSDALFALAFRDTVGSAQIDAGAIGNSKMENMPAATVKGSVAGGTPADLTAAQLTALINVFSPTLSGAVPAATGGSLTTQFLRKDGTWVVPSSAAAGSGTEIQFRNAGVPGAVSGSSVSGNSVTFGGNVTGGSFEIINVITINNGSWGNRMGSGFIWGWSSTSTPYATPDLFYRRKAAATFCLGNTDAASPVAQCLAVQSATGTNASAAAAVFSIDGAQGTGTGAGGDVRIRVAPNGSSGSSQNAHVEAVRFRATDLAAQCAGAVIAGGPVVLPSFTCATVPSASLWPRGQIWVSDDQGGPTPAYSTGTSWLRVADRTVVAPV